MHNLMRVFKSARQGFLTRSDCTSFQSVCMRCHLLPLVIYEGHEASPNEHVESTCLEPRQAMPKPAHPATHLYKTRTLVCSHAVERVFHDLLHTEETPSSLCRELSASRHSKIQRSHVPRENTSNSSRSTRSETAAPLSDRADELLIVRYAQFVRAFESLARTRVFDQARGERKDAALVSV
jgi:hypothetical protein